MRSKTATIKIST